MKFDIIILLFLSFQYVRLIIHKIIQAKIIKIINIEKCFKLSYRKHMTVGYDFH